MRDLEKGSANIFQVQFIEIQSINDWYTGVVLITKLNHYFIRVSVNPKTFLDS